MIASLICLFAIFTEFIACAEDYVHSPIQYHSQNDRGSYNYGYDTGLFGSHQFHQEHKDDSGRVSGRYGYTDPYGKLRLVNYISGPEGYQVISDTEDDKRPLTNIIESVPQISPKIAYTSPSKVILSKRIPPQPVIISQEPQLFEEQVIVSHEPNPSHVIIPQQPLPVKAIIPPPPVKALKTQPKLIIPQYPIEEQVQIHQQPIPVKQVSIPPKVIIPPQPIEQQLVLHEEPVPVKTFIPPSPALVKAVYKPPLIIPQQVHVHQELPPVKEVIIPPKVIIPPQPIQQQVVLHEEPVPVKSVIHPPLPQQQVVLHEHPIPVKTIIPPLPVKALVKPPLIPQLPIEQQIVVHEEPVPILPPPQPVKAVVNTPLIIQQQIEQQVLLHEEPVPILPPPQPVKAVVKPQLITPQQPIIHQTSVPVIPRPPVKAIVEPNIIIPQQPIVEQLHIHQQPLPVKEVRRPPTVVIPQQVIEEQAHIHQEQHPIQEVIQQQLIEETAVIKPIAVKELIHPSPVKTQLWIPPRLPSKVIVTENKIISSVKRPLYHYRPHESVKRYYAGIDYATGSAIKAPSIPIVPTVIASASIQSPIQRFRSAALIARSVDPHRS